jgi:hypothetical protein
MSNLEAALVAIMRADRAVIKRRRDAQDLKDEDATEDATSAAKIERSRRRS